MDPRIETFARELLKEDLSKCTPKQQLMFKRMYSHLNLKLDINDIVDKMPWNMINSALRQTSKTIEENNKKQEKLTDEQAHEIATEYFKEVQKNAYRT
jgi:hypothetical protein